MRVKQRDRRPATSKRSGTVLVENALVISVFALFLAGIMEFGHCYLVIGTLNAAAKRGARYGACEGVTTAQVTAQVNGILSKSIKSAKATVLVKDASAFDTTGFNANNVNYGSLPNIELSNASARQMYVVRVTVPYKDVALLPPFWVKTATLHGQSVMRHE